MKVIPSIAMSIALVFTTQLVHASTRGLRTDIAVVSPSTLPQLTQEKSEDLLLHSDNGGNTYLYLEQEDGARLVVLDVTDPAHVKLAASVETELSQPYDFVQAVGTNSELIRFRNGAGIAFLNFRHAKAPRVVNVRNFNSEPIEILGQSGYLAVARQAGIDAVSLHGRDVQVIDTSTAPLLLATVTHATREASRTATGTTFLLGDQGLTVIRRIDVEEQHAQQEASERGN